MKNVERRDRQLPYISDAEVMEQQMNARRLTQKLNTIDRSDFDGIAAIVKELFGKSEGAFVNPPFYCDYGFHIEVGKNFFANYPMRRKTPCFSYGDIRRVHRIYASN